MSNGLEVLVKQGPEADLLRVSGELCLAHLEPLRQDLLERLQGGRPVILDLAGACTADLSGLQLLCSAHRAFQGRALSFSISSIPEWLRAAASAAGFHPQTSVCPHRQAGGCLWAEGGQR